MVSNNLSARNVLTTREDWREYRPTIHQSISLVN
jgi:hypothetical protein